MRIPGLAGEVFDAAVVRSQDRGWRGLYVDANRV